MNMHSRIALAPVEPTSLEETGISTVFARDIFLKTMFRKNLELASHMAKELCVTVLIVMELVEMCRKENLIETLGNDSGSVSAVQRQ